MFLTIRAMGTCMFSKLKIGCKVLWRPIKMMENTWVIVSCCWILGLLDFKYCEKLNWSRMDFFYCWGLIGLHRCWLGIKNLNQLVLIFKDWLEDPHFSCQTFVMAKSFDDFGDVEVDFLDQIEEEFEDQLDHYVKLVDMTNFDS